MGTAIVVTSGKGGTGKTTACAAISSCLAQLGQRVLCVDCDVGLKNLDLQLGFTDAAPRDFTDVIDGRLSLADAPLAHPDIEGLFFLSAPVTVSPEEISREGMMCFTAEAKARYDYVLLDSPAGLGPGFALSVAGADMAIVVTTGDASSLRDGQRTVAELHARGIENVRLLVNRVRKRLLRRSGVNIDDLIDAVGARLIGMVGEDESVTLAANLEIPLIRCEGSTAAEQFSRVARRICGEKVPVGKL